MDALWIAVAFACGFAVRQAGLPPLLGFLAAGFVLEGIGFQGGESLEYFSELGVTLLLFSIGLKLRIKSLLRPEIWAVTSIHMGLTVLVFGALLTGLSVLPLPVFESLDLRTAVLLAFALSFSSTVFAVKVFEDKGEMHSLQGRIAIGVLVMQDIIAVLFLAASTGKVPSVWALGLIALVPARRLLTAAMDRSGHGELLILYGLLLALGGAILFDRVGLKGDLGALILGVLVAEHPRAGELAEALLGFKDLFLVGFFLTIGLNGLPTPAALGAGAIIAAALPAKMALFFFLFTRFHLRARTATLTTFGLSNYSEFGLIVGALAVSKGWLSTQWLVIIAIALSISFVAASVLDRFSHRFYRKNRRWLTGFESETRLPYDRPIEPGDAEILVFGMGRVGSVAYETMRQRHGEIVLGLDNDSDVVRRSRRKGWNVIADDATDPDFWEKLKPGKVRLVMLTMPKADEVRIVAELLRQSGFPGMVAAAARYPEDAEKLEAAGIDGVFRLYEGLGAGFADFVCLQMGKC